MDKVHWWQEGLNVDSSKRIFGGTAAGMGIAMKLSLFLVSLFIVPADAATASAQADGLLYGGFTVLGITGLTDIVAAIFPKKATP